MQLRFFKLGTVLTYMYAFNFSENWNDLSEKVYIITKFSLSSFIWHQLQGVLPMHDQARTILNDDVRIDLRRIGI